MLVVRFWHPLVTLTTSTLVFLALGLGCLAQHPETSPDSRSWLARINEYRELARLDPVEEDPNLSGGALNHARYLVKRFEEEAAENVDVHSESRDTAWSTSSGANAASLSNIALRAGVEQPTDQSVQSAEVIDDWMTDPFERLPILDPELHKVGFGIYREKGFTTLVLQVKNPRPAEEATLGSVEEYLRNNRPREQSPKYPIMFPPDGATTSLRAYAGGGWPDPSASCPGFGWTGLPITLELGPATQEQTIFRHSLLADGEPVRHYIYTQSTYLTTDINQTLVGRRDLTAFGAIVIISRAPLRTGKSYTVSLARGAKEYRWSFTVR